VLPVTHSRNKTALVGLLLGALLTGGCGTVATVAVPEPVAVQEPAAAPSPGAVRLTGDVRAPRELDADDLAALPHHTVAVEYESGSSISTRTRPTAAVDTSSTGSGTSC